MGSVFSSSTIYQVVAVLETLFSVVTFAFGIKTLFVFLGQDDSFRTPRDFILYSAIAAIIHSTIQVILSVLLVAKSETKARNREGRRDPGIVPRIWLILAPFQLAVLLFIFIAPMGFCIGEYEEWARDKNGIALMRCGVAAAKNEEEESQWLNLRTSIHEMYTYVVTNTIFKFFFIWMVSTTVPFSCCRKGSSRTELIINSNGHDSDENEKDKEKVITT